MIFSSSSHSGCLRSRTSPAPSLPLSGAHVVAVAAQTHVPAGSLNRPFTAQFLVHQSQSTGRCSVHTVLPSLTAADEQARDGPCRPYLAAERRDATERVGRADAAATPRAGGVLDDGAVGPDGSDLTVVHAESEEDGPRIERVDTDGAERAFRAAGRNPAESDAPASVCATSPSPSTPPSPRASTPASSEGRSTSVSSESEQPASARAANRELAPSKWTALIASPPRCIR